MIRISVISQWWVGWKYIVVQLYYLQLGKAPKKTLSLFWRWSDKFLLKNLGGCGQEEGHWRLELWPGTVPGPKNNPRYRTLNTLHLSIKLGLLLYDTDELTNICCIDLLIRLFSSPLQPTWEQLYRYLGAPAGFQVKANLASDDL